MSETMKFVRESEVHDIYQCIKCEKYFKVPRGCDIPFCEECDQNNSKSVKRTSINISKTYWAIVRCGDPNGYHTGTKHMETTLIETDTATELNEILADGSVESGESMGDFIFKVLCVSHQNLNELEEKESDYFESKEEAQAYAEVYDYEGC